MGFYGPLIDMENSIEKNSAKLSQSIYYKCYHGKVLDIYSNRRYFSVPCLNTTPEFEYPKEWPRCVSPKNCIGPSNLQVGKIHTLRLPNFMHTIFNWVRPKKKYAKNEFLSV